ncbi:rRNA methyltransferase [Olea europaea subsp. europaea]|uniref:rRNA methyltransferase n=1 Tax=Olea europaea subsp. europaea TaxID=158383 RepID=A0A8S0VAH0_OLEEU|nr:rRNA methyltransferase [Olea europaea subsp. europaea]
MGEEKENYRFDENYQFAKEHGYRSIAAGKLVQLDSKFGFFRSANSVLDLCAAPGSWMQVAVEKLPVGSLVIGVDRDSIQPIDGAFSVRESITAPKCKDVINKLMADNGCRAFDLVLHDGYTGICGTWLRVAINQNALVFDSIKLATEFLAAKGTFVTKVFRSEYCSGILFCLSQLFEKVEVYKPKDSFRGEFYAVGLKYKAPTKIDPDLLSIELLLQGKEHRKVVDAFRVTKQKQYCDGHGDGNATLRKVCSAADFVSSSSLLEKLGLVTSKAFEVSACLCIEDEEIKALCDDLHLFLKRPLKHHLRWYTYTKKVTSSQKATSVTMPMRNDNKEDEKKVLNEMEELTNTTEQKKRTKKRIAKRLAKDKDRKELDKQKIDATKDGNTDQELFSLTFLEVSLPSALYFT